MANFSIVSITPIPAVFASTVQANVDLGTGPGRAVLVLAFLDSTDATQVITGAAIGAGNVAMTGGATYSRYGGGTTNTHRLFTLAGGSLPSGTQAVKITANNANRKPAGVVVVIKDADGGDLTFGTETPAYSVFGVAATSGAVPSTAGDFVVAVSRRDGSAGSAGTGSAGTTVLPTVNCTSYQCDAWWETAAGTSTTLDATYSTPSARSDIVSIAITSSAGGGGGTALAANASAVAAVTAGLMTRAALSASLSAAATITGAILPTVTVGPVENSGGSVLGNTLIENVAVLRSSDRVSIISAANIMTSANGFLVVASATLVPGVKYQVASWNADGTAGGIGQATAV